MKVFLTSALGDLRKSRLWLGRRVEDCSKSHIFSELSHTVAQVCSTVHMSTCGSIIISTEHSPKFSQQIDGSGRGFYMVFTQLLDLVLDQATC